MALKRILLPVCKTNGYRIQELHYLFNTLIVSLFTCCIMVRGVVSYTKYLSQIYRLQNIALIFRYILYNMPYQSRRLLMRGMCSYGTVLWALLCIHFKFFLNVEAVLFVKRENTETFKNFF